MKVQTVLENTCLHKNRRALVAAPIHSITVRVYICILIKSSSAGLCSRNHREQFVLDIGPLHTSDIHSHPALFDGWMVVFNRILGVFQIQCQPEKIATGMQARNAGWRTYKPTYTHLPALKLPLRRLDVF